jgi:hypothetical protein
MCLLAFIVLWNLFGVGPACLYHPPAQPTFAEMEWSAPRAKAYDDCSGPKLTWSDECVAALVESEDDDPPPGVDRGCSTEEEIYDKEHRELLNLPPGECVRAFVAIVSGRGETYLLECACPLTRDTTCTVAVGTNL